MGLTAAPAFRLTADGQDITAVVQAHLSDLTATDEAGMEADSLDFTLAVTAGFILPRTGTNLRLWLGYEGAALTEIGAFVVDKVSITGRPRTLKVTAKAADMGGTLKAPRTRAWEGQTIGSLVQAVAAEHGYQAAVGTDLAGVSLAHLDQTDESDMHLLTRLASERGAVFKAADGKLIFAPAGEAKAVSGKSLPSVSLTEGECADWSCEFEDRAAYVASVAYWQDTATGQRRVVRVGEAGEPVTTRRRPYPDEATARAAAAAGLKTANRGTGTFTARLAGRPEFFAEGPLTLRGFDPAVDGKWIISRCTHTLSRSGFVTDLTAKPPTD